MQVIIYIQDNGIPAVVTPTPEILKTKSIYQVAVKDVPEGKRFKILNANDLPNTPQETWIVNTNDLTDGVGGKYNEFN
jgi:hypothetical protein